MKYLLFVHQGGPVVGAVKVPPCFEIAPEFALTALESNLSLLVVTEEQLAEKLGLEGLLLEQGRCMLEILNALMNDPEMFDHPLLTDPNLN